MEIKVFRDHFFGSDPVRAHGSDFFHAFYENIHKSTNPPLINRVTPKTIPAYR